MAPVFKLFAILVLFTTVIGNDALNCYRCHDCADLSNESTQLCNDEEIPHPHATTNGTESKADPEWWCYKTIHIHTPEEGAEMRHVRRDCTDTKTICDDDSNCELCQTDGCNGSNSVMVSSSLITFFVIMIKLV